MSKEMKKAVGAVRGCFKRAGLQRGDRLLLACSGGRDSLALARASQICARKLGHFLAAAVVDHGIQEGSEKVARQAVDRLKEIGIQNSRALKTS
ncbi:MAG: tRNA(Ile)-lysidine synthetase, partial [Aeriscardovia sp.]|nr:tRNA(Ile)-lysidine synthetase [Aeriscardovia sp.]